MDKTRMRRRHPSKGTSMTKDEALKLALEALEDAAYCVQKNYCPDKMGHDWDDTITAIKEALAHPWVGLTDEERLRVLQFIDPKAVRFPLGFKQIAESIERLLKEKNT